MSDADALRDLLKDKPDLESALSTLVRVDENHETWSFDDVPLDSGAFGELVSEGIVESIGDQYRLSDPTAVRTVLDGEDDLPPDDTRTRTRRWGVPSLPAIDRVEAVLIGCSLVLVVAFRLIPFVDVFRQGRVVLSGNDPYYYRYWVERLLSRSGGLLDLSPLATLPDSVLSGEPLLIAVLWAASEVLGGTSQTVGMVLAWYPVVAAVIVAGLLYVFSRTVIGDKRVALTAVAFLAVTPAHAFRTSLGFADHHAFDFVWVTLTALAIVKTVDDRGSGDRNVVWPLVLAVGIAGQSLAWNAGPLLVVPVGLFVFGDSLLSLHADEPLLSRLGPLLGGVGAGTGAVGIAHLGFGWQQSEGVAALVVLLFGCFAVTAAAEAGRLRGWSPSLTAGVDVAAGAAGLIVLWMALPGVRGRFVNGIVRLTTRSEIAEVQPLLSFDSFGFVLLFGFGLVLAIPVLAWSLFYARDGYPKWLAVGIYAGWFLLLSLFQLRFVGELSVFVAFLDAVAFFWLAGAVNLVERPAPFGPAAVKRLSIPPGDVLRGLAVLFVLLTALSVVQTPVKINQLQVDDGDYQSAVWMSEYATDRGLTYPDSYVFSRWGQNRMFNYFVNGNARSYAFAQQHYSDFARSQEPDRWYERLRGRVGFIVTQNRTANSLGADSLVAMLHDQFGDGRSGFGHYRLRYVGIDGNPKVFTLVRGAKLVGHGAPETTYTLTTEPTVSGERERVTYTREIRTGPGGVFNVTVPYSGEYVVANRTVQVSDSAVERGSRVVNLGSNGLAHWTFAEGTGNVSYDYARGRRVFGTDGHWTEGVRGSGIEFSPGETGLAVQQASYGVRANESLTIAMYVRGNLTASDDVQRSILRYQAGGGTFYEVYARNRWNDFGMELWGTDGRTRNFGIQTTSFTSWTHIAVVIDREADELRLYRNGTLASASSLGGDRRVYDGGTFVVGPKSTEATGFAIDELRLYQDSLTSSEISTLANETE